MDLNAVVSQTQYLFSRAAGVWIASWTLRYRLKCDYRLSDTARLIRWAVVLLGFALGASLPSAWARVTAGLVGLAFLCWPNIAYYFTNLVRPQIIIVQGQVTSVAYDGSRAKLGYSFTYGGNGFGGEARVKRRVLAPDWTEGQPVRVAFDPLNPDKSKVSPVQ